MNETLTGMTITIEQIEALRTEAAQHGDVGDGSMVDICDAALSDIRTGARDAGSTKWTKRCADAILAARAMDEVRS